MNYLKVVLMLWTYNIAFVTSETAAVVRGSINASDDKQKFCGQTLTGLIQIVCKEKKTERRRRPRDTVGQMVARHSTNLLLQKSCCDDACSINFIKAHCPVKRKSPEMKNATVPPSYYTIIFTNVDTTTSTSATPTSITSTTTTTTEKPSLSLE